MDIEETQNINKEIEEIENGSKLPAYSGHPYPIEKLEPEQFEILLYLLFKGGLNSDKYNRINEHDNTYLLKPVKDRGRDVTLFLDGKCIANIQCKRYNSSITKPNLIKEVLKFILYTILDKTLIGKKTGFQYIFATTDDLTDPAQSLIEDFGNNIKSDPKIESFIQEVMKAKAFKDLKFEGKKDEVIDKASKLDFVHLNKVDINELIEKDDEVKSTFFKLKTIIINERIEPIPQALTAPPFHPPTFIGRDNDMQRLKDELPQGQPIVLLVNGEGGMGKTTLISQYYHQNKDEYKHTAWLTNESNLTNTLLSLADSLQLDFKKSTLKPKEQLEQLLQKMANLNKTCLLVIDNANDLQDIKNNFGLIHRCSNFHVLLTTRINQLAEAKFFSVKGLKPKDAQKLFKQHYPNHITKEDDLLSKILKEIDYNTLLIELLAKNLNNRNCFETSYSLNKLYEDIQQNLLKLSQSSSVETTYQAKGTGLRNESPEAILLAIYNINELNEAEKQLMSIMAVLPKSAVPFKTLNVLLPDFDLQTHAKSLHEKGWIGFDKENNTFKTNQLIQDVVKEKHKDRILQDCEALISTLRDFLSKDNLTHKNQIENSKILSSFAESVLKNLNVPQPLLFNLANYYCSFCNRTGEILRALTASKIMKNIAKGLVQKYPKKEDYKALLAISFSSLAESYYKQSEFVNAILFHEKNLSQLKTLDRRNLVKFSKEHIENNLSVAKNRLGILYRDSGNLKKASELQLGSLVHIELLSANSKEYKKGKLEANKELGHINLELGKNGGNSNQRNLYLNEAKGYAEEHHRLAKELNKSNPNKVDYRNDVASSYQLLGRIHKGLGNYDLAEKFFIKQNKESVSICEDYPDDIQMNINLACSYVNLSCFYKDCSNNNIEAKRYFEKAKTKYEEIQLKHGNQVNLQDRIDEINEILSNF